MTRAAAIGVPGLHNARNAAVAAVAALRAGAPFAAAESALARFAGVSRRFEFRGEANGVTFVDDYAHLPTECGPRCATGASAAGGPASLRSFQPHRFSRTAALADQFGTAFVDADVLVVTDVYGAGERPVPGVSGRLVGRRGIRPGPAPAGRVRARLEMNCARRCRRCYNRVISASPSGPGTSPCCPTSCWTRRSGEHRAGRAVTCTGADPGARATLMKPLGPLTTYGVGGPAALFVEVDGPADLDVVRAVLAEGAASVPLFVIGRGSNLLVADAGFDGIVVHLGAGFASLDLPGSDGADGVEGSGGGPAVVRAGAALALPVLARRVADAGWTGLAWAVGVPGSVGGAVRMNAGGHGSDMASCLRTWPAAAAA